jgi:hypothetical protein
MTAIPRDALRSLPGCECREAAGVDDALALSAAPVFRAVSRKPRLWASFCSCCKCDWPSFFAPEVISSSPIANGHRILLRPIPADELQRPPIAKVAGRRQVDRFAIGAAMGLISEWSPNLPQPRT